MSSRQHQLNGSVFRLPQLNQPDLRPVFGIPEGASYRIQLGEDDRIEEIYWWEEGERVSRRFESGTGPRYDLTS